MPHKKHYINSEDEYSAHSPGGSSHHRAHKGGQRGQQGVHNRLNNLISGVNKNIKNNKSRNNAKNYSSDYSSNSFEICQGGSNISFSSHADSNPNPSFDCQDLGGRNFGPF